MAICSYLAYAMDGQTEQLRAELEALEGCVEVREAEQHDVLIFVTDTPSKKADMALQEKLSQLSSLKCLALIFMSRPEMLQAKGASV